MKSVGTSGDFNYLCIREKQKELNNIKTDKIMKKYVCTVCNWIYDPAVGDPDSGIAPGTLF